VKTVVWTDGSCNANGMHGRGGWAARIEQAGTVREISPGVRTARRTLHGAHRDLRGLGDGQRGRGDQADSTYVDRLARAAALSVGESTMDAS
jgi:hypothetical protein